MTKQTLQSDHANGGAIEIADLNDQLRQLITNPGTNRVVMTMGIADLFGDVSLFRGFRKRAELIRIVREYDTFGEDIDPYHERDMGKFKFEGVSCYWKIDYYNLDLSAGSEEPSDPSQTTLVLTIMRVEER